MIHTTLESTLNAARMHGREPLLYEALTGINAMAWIFEDAPTSKCLGLFTHSFAERFCSENPGYIWRAV